MQRFAFLIALIAFFSFALASPLPVQAVQEREPVLELSIREAPMDSQILHREVTTDTKSGVNILAREHESFEDYVQEMTDGKKTARDTEDIEPRICRIHMCQ
jgi:hypothetical protein